MASIVRRPGRRWEIRESVIGSAGPRSRTLATFDVLTPEVLAHAASRATRALDPERVRARARSVGAPVAPRPADAAARALLAAAVHGERPRPILGCLVAELLGEDRPPPTDAARAAAVWAGRPPAERAEALCDLLLLADALPVPADRARRRMPRITSRG